MKQKKSIERGENLMSLITAKELPDVKTLAAQVNDLIENDFQQLISILYRIDVSEEKLRLLLKENPGTDAGLIIVNLIIERQLQKIESRKKFKRNENAGDEESW
jgi:hypothetical protein